MPQTLRVAQRFAERGALGTQPAEVRGMLGIAANAYAAVGRHGREYAAADAAIRAGGPDRVFHKIRCLMNFRGYFSNPYARNKSYEKQSDKRTQRAHKHQLGSLGTMSAPDLYVTR